MACSRVNFTFTLYYCFMLSVYIVQGNSTNRESNNVCLLHHKNCWTQLCILTTGRHLTFLILNFLLSVVTIRRKLTRVSREWRQTSVRECGSRGNPRQHINSRSYHANDSNHSSQSTRHHSPRKWIQNVKVQTRHTRNCSHCYRLRNFKHYYNKVL
jgi:hypothetical protein